MLRRIFLTVCCLLGTTCALADIYVWEGSADDCTIYHYNNTIEINEPGTYGFRAWDGSSSLEEIQELKINSSVTGTVTVSIAYDSNGSNGATYIEKLDLTGGSGTGNLDDLYISGDLGTVSTIACDNVTGTVTCVDIDNGITIQNNLTGSSLQQVQFREPLRSSTADSMAHLQQTRLEM